MDRSFGLLMCGQYLACIAAALWLSPRTWAGTQSWTHVHVWAAIFLGAAITSLPVVLAWTRPGEVLTRHVVAVGQMLMSGLFIHVTGGRIETHFHIFGSLAFLAFYRDPRVLVTASVVVALDHFFRGVFWPQSVFGTPVVEYWRWLEHTGWVVFEDLFLVVFIHQNLRVLRENAEQRADLERARDVAEQASRAKDDFIAVLSHELRTPLTPSVMLLSSLAEDPTLEPAAREDIAIIRRNIEVEARLIDDLLDLTRIACGKIELARGNVDIHDTVAHMVEMCRADFAAKRISLACRFDAKSHFVEGDSSRLLQVVWNLMKNALKFTNPGGSVELTTANAGGAIRIEIRDTGIGIPSDVLPHLFQRFQQGGAAVTRQYGGLGLGLWICRTIVEMHGGQIRATSEGAGRGARFVVELPVAAAVAVAAEPRSRAWRSRSGGEESRIAGRRSRRYTPNAGEAADAFRLSRDHRGQRRERVADRK